MKYLKVFTDFAEKIDLLSDAEVGRLFKSMLEYAANGTESELKGNERFLWSMAKLEIDRQADNYEKMCDTNKRIATNRYGSLRKATGKHESCQDKEKDKDKDKDKEKDKEEEKKEKEIPDGISNKKAAAGPPRAPASFERFWTAYPKKVGKEAARKAYSRAKVPVERLLHALEAQKGSTQWQVENGRFIPNPATWLNQGRWEDEVCDPRKAAAYTGGESDDESIRRVKRHMEEKRKLKTGDKDGA